MPSNLSPALLLAASLTATAAAQSTAAAQPAVAAQSAVLSSPPRVADAHDRLLIDAPGDGSILVRGRNWKAAFTTSGASFVPFFGSDAPRNFPVDFVFDGVTVGGGDLAVGAGDRPRCTSDRDRATVEIGRGAITETYLLVPEHVEQRFVFAQRAGRGDLAVRMRVRSELTASPLDDGGFRFANELGEVRYGRAEAFDAAGRRTAVTSTLVDGVLQLTVPASFHDRATFPLTIDPVIAVIGFALGTPSFTQATASHLANFGGQHALVYVEQYSATDHDIHLRLYDETGLVTYSGAVDLSTVNLIHPSIACNRNHNQFLVVAERSAPSTSGITGRTFSYVPALGATWSPQFAVSGSNHGKNPEVGGDPNVGSTQPGHYCVVWEGLANQRFYCNVVRTNATLAYTNGLWVDVGPSITNTSISKSCGVGSSAREWIVVYQKQYSAVDEDIYAERIDYQGQVAPQSIVVDYSTFSDTNPAVSSKTDPVNGQERFLVCYERYQPATSFNPAHSDIMGSLWAGASSPSGTVNLTALLQSSVLSDQRAPSVDTDGCRFAVGYTQQSWFTGTDVAVRLAAVHPTATGGLAVSEQPIDPHGSPGVHGNFRIAAERSGGGSGPRYVGAWDFAFWDPIFGGSSVLPFLCRYAGHLPLPPSSYFQPALPGCGPLTLTASGLPASGDTFSLSMAGAQGFPLLIVGQHIAPFAICGPCQLGIDLASVTLFSTPTTTFTLNADPQWIGTTFGAQGIDLLAPGGCSAPFDFTLSNEIVVTIL